MLRCFLYVKNRRVQLLALAATMNISLEEDAKIPTAEFLAKPLLALLS